MRKMVSDSKISDYSMYNTGNSLSSSANCPYPNNTNSSSNSFTSSSNYNKSQSNADCNVNYYCHNPKFDHKTNHWSESAAAIHQQAQQEPNYFRNQWHFNSAASNSYHVNDTTISHIPTSQLSQNQQCLLIPHAQYPHSSSQGKSIWP